MLAMFGIGMTELLIVLGLLCLGFPTVMIIVLVVWLNKSKHDGPGKE